MRASKNSGANKTFASFRDTPVLRRSLRILPKLNRFPSLLRKRFQADVRDGSGIGFLPDMNVQKGVSSYQIDISEVAGSRPAMLWSRNRQHPDR